LPTEKLTDKATESDLEARIQETISRVFPWLEPKSVSHQTKFSFTFGRTQLDVDGGKVSRHEARTDILLNHQGQPFAVLELKRPGHALSQGDTEQGLSYARMIHPRPPLVIVTNGTETKSFETHSGQPWAPNEPSEKAVQNLIASAAKVAVADMRRATDVLLGPGSEVWASAVRAASRSAILEMSGTLNEPLQPFAHEFLVPRSATDQAIELLQSSGLLIIEGAPLAGKSNVLRDMALRTEISEILAMLYIEAEPGGTGVVQRLANILADALGCPYGSMGMRGCVLSAHRRSQRGRSFRMCCGRSQHGGIIRATFDAGEADAAASSLCGHCGFGHNQRERSYGGVFGQNCFQFL
jgi:hypothetical protein